MSNINNGNIHCHNSRFMQRKKFEKKPSITSRIVKAVIDKIKELEELIRNNLSLRNGAIRNRDSTQKEIERLENSWSLSAYISRKAGTVENLKKDRDNDSALIKRIDERNKKLKAELEEAKKLLKEKKVHEAHSLLHKNRKQERKELYSPYIKKAKEVSKGYKKAETQCIREGIAIGVEAASLATGGGIGVVVGKAGAKFLARHVAKSVIKSAAKKASTTAKKLALRKAKEAAKKSAWAKFKRNSFKIYRRARSKTRVAINKFSRNFIENGTKETVNDVMVSGIRGEEIKAKDVLTNFGVEGAFGTLSKLSKLRPLKYRLGYEGLKAITKAGVKDYISNNYSLNPYVKGFFAKVSRRLYWQG